MIPDSSVKTNPRTEAFSPRGDRHQSVLRSIGNRSVLHLMCLLIAGLYHPSFPRRSTGTRGYFSPAAQPIHIFDRMNKIDKTTTPHCHCGERSDVAISSTHRATSPPFLVPTVPRGNAYSQPSFFTASLFVSKAPYAFPRRSMGTS